MHWNKIADELKSVSQELTGSEKIKNERHFAKAFEDYMDFNWSEDQISVREADRIFGEVFEMWENGEIDTIEQMMDETGEIAKRRERI